MPDVAMKIEKVLKQATVCFLRRENQILLAIKARHIGEGCWNGYGGGIEAGESPRQAAVRELKEETGGVIAKPEDLNKIAEIDFHNTKTDKSTFVCKVHFYLASQWEGDVHETEEMLRPTWFEIDQLPLEEMMPADQTWLPIALSGKNVKAEDKYGPFQKTLLDDFELNLVERFDD
jgi:8-oxo-dGTP pyrophosphatase MutT (NUDIX family)